MRVPACVVVLHEAQHLHVQVVGQAPVEVGAAQLATVARLVDLEGGQDDDLRPRRPGGHAPRATVMTCASWVRSITGSGGGRPVDGESRTVATVDAHVMSRARWPAGPPHPRGPGRARPPSGRGAAPSAAGVGSVTRPLTPSRSSSVGPPLSVQVTTGVPQAIASTVMSP